MNHLRLCAVGNTQWLGHNSRSFGGRFYCPVGSVWPTRYMRFSPRCGK